MSGDSIINITPPAADPWAELRQHTPARIALGRAGGSLPTGEVLRFAAAHAQARDAVHVPLDVGALDEALRQQGWSTLQVHSRATTRDAYLRRPDWGRRLDEGSVERLQAQAPAQSAVNPAMPVGPDLCIVVADGLSATGVQQHAAPLLEALRQALAQHPAGAPTLVPIVIAQQARVALADEIGELLGAQMVLILLGERPGLSSPDSVGAYLTHAPRVGCTDAQRNCVSNIRPLGLGFAVAAQRLAWLVREGLRRGVTGVGLKDDSGVEVIDL